MKQKLLLKTMLLLCALIAGSTSVWADATPVVTADFTAKTVGNSNYTNTWTYGDWSLTNCSNNNKSWAYIRCGGKGGSKSTDTNTDATTIQGTAKLTKAIGEVKVIHSGTSNNNFTVNSIVLEVSSKSDFSVIDVTKTLTPSISKQVAGTVSFTEGAPYAAQSYYRITINWTVKGTSNYGLDITKIEFYEATTPHTLSSAVSPAASGTVTLGATSVSEGLTTTITATPNAGYRFVNWSVTGTGSSVASTTSASTTFTMGTEDATVTANFEEIPSHTLSSAITPVGAGTVTFGSASVKEGATTTATAAANAGYEFTGWSISGEGATLSSTTENPTTVTMGTANATVTATFTAVTTHEINWSVNGTIVKTENIKEGNALSFAAPTSGIPAGYVFRGWVTEANKIDTPTDADPSANYVTSGNSTTDITYYAVIAVVTGGTPASLTKMVKGDTFAADDKVVIVAAIDESTNYAMYQETTNSSYVKYYSFTESAESVASDDKNWWTVSAGTGSTWKLGDATNGYLYSSSSNNLAADKSNASEWTLEDNEDGTFSLTQGRYLSCRSDLSGTNQYLYRLAGSTPAGVYKLNIYKYVAGNATYANYCTTAPTTTTVTLAAACTDGAFYYGTYSNYRPFVVPSDLIVSEIKVVDGKLSISNYDTDDIVPANTGVMISSDESGSHTLTFADVAGTSKLGANNMLKASSVAMTGDNKFYRLTMHNGTTLGFYWGAASGASFALAANKAYLAVPNTVSAPAFFGFGSEVTSIESIMTQKTKGEVYDLQGRKVTKPAKGLYIVNGKKYVVK